MVMRNESRTPAPSPERFHRLPRYLPLPHTVPHVPRAMLGGQSLAHPQPATDAAVHRLLSAVLVEEHGYGIENCTVMPKPCMEGRMTFFLLCLDASDGERDSSPHQRALDGQDVRIFACFYWDAHALMVY